MKKIEVRDFRDLLEVWQTEKSNDFSVADFQRALYDFLGQKKYCSLFKKVSKAIDKDKGLIIKKRDRDKEERALLYQNPYTYDPAAPLY